jgi:peroxiredoxin
MKIRFTGWFAAAAILAGGAFPASAEPDAAALLKSMSDDIAAQPRFAFSSAIAYRGTFGDESEEMVTDYDIAIDREGKGSVRVENADLELSMYTTGTQLIRYVPMLDQYMADDAEVSPALLVQNAGFSIVEPIVILLAEVAETEPFASIGGAATYVGAETVGDTKAHRIRAAHNGRNFDLWIADGDTPALLQITADMSDVAEQMKTGNGFANVQIDVVASISDWSQDVSDAQLTFTAPEDAQQVAAFQPPRQPSPADALIGQPAPNFELRLLDGGTIELAAKKDKEIVVLDFWATWCGPCRVAMPVIDRVTKEFEDQGVRLYAVNLEEEPEQIREYLKSVNLSIQVALDTDGSVAEAYKAFSIPQTVIVDKDGTVQVVHVGYSPNMEAELREQLTQLTEGESLAP